MVEFIYSEGYKREFMVKTFISSVAKEIPIFTIKAIIIAFIAFAFLQSYIPSGQLLLIMPEYMREFSEFLDRNNIKKQMIGSLGSTYAVDEKIDQLMKKGDFEMIEYAREHKSSLRCNGGK